MYGTLTDVSENVNNTVFITNKGNFDFLIAMLFGAYCVLCVVLMRFNSKPTLLTYNRRPAHGGTHACKVKTIPSSDYFRKINYCFLVIVLLVFCFHVRLLYVPRKSETHESIHTIYTFYIDRVR